MQNGRPRVLVSACLMGRPVRYDGSAKSIEAKCLARWSDQGRLISVCPELLAGLPTPRPAAEIYGVGGGNAVLSRASCIIEADGSDVTGLYLRGAEAALAAAAQQDCKYALLTDGSPSCGSSFIYDGNFCGNRLAGAGVTTAILRRHGIEVFSQNEIDKLIVAMDA